MKIRVKIKLFMWHMGGYKRMLVSWFTVDFVIENFDILAVSLLDLTEVDTRIKFVCFTLRFGLFANPNHEWKTILLSEL